MNERKNKTKDKWWWIIEKMKLTRAAQHALATGVHSVDVEFLPTIARRWCQRWRTRKSTTAKRCPASATYPATASQVCAYLREFILLVKVMPRANPRQTNRKRNRKEKFIRNGFGCVHSTIDSYERKRDDSDVEMEREREQSTSETTDEIRCCQTCWFFDSLPFVCVFTCAKHCCIGIDTNAPNSPDTFIAFCHSISIWWQTPCTHHCFEWTTHFISVAEDVVSTFLSSRFAHREWDVVCGERARIFTIGLLLTFVRATNDDCESKHTGTSTRIQRLPLLSIYFAYIRFLLLIWWD